MCDVCERDGEITVAEDSNAIGESMAQVEASNRQVIEDKLLCSLDDDGVVAILVNEDDLAMMICAMAWYAVARADNERMLEMVADMKKLREGAFGDHSSEKG